MATNISSDIRRAVDTGKVVFGQKQCQKEMLKGKGELLIVSKNMPGSEKERIKYIAEVNNKKIVEVEQTGISLGSVCGKPFVVSTLLVLDAGKSNILEKLKEEKTKK